MNHGNQEAALRAAMADAQPGDVIVIHTPTCPIKQGDETTCGCTPIVFTMPEEGTPS